MKKKVIILLMSALLWMGLLAGCGGQNAVEDAKGTDTGIGEEESADTDTEEEDADDVAYVMSSLSCQSGDDTINGQLCLPVDYDGESKLPVIICSHGFNMIYAGYDMTQKELAAAGYATYAYDFVNGSMWSSSGTDTTKMTLYTEKQNLEDVVAFIRQQDFADPDRIYLMGESQGALVTVMAASDHPDIADALLLYYPAFSIPEGAREQYASVDEIPETMNVFAMDLGRDYYATILDYDAYEAMTKCTMPVLILHGTEDARVDISYSEKSLDYFPNATLVKMEGEPHGFTIDGQVKAAAEVVAFLQDYE